MIRADGFVAISYGRFFSDEQRSIVAQILDEVIAIGDVQLEMLGSIVVAQAYRFGGVISEIDDSVIAPGEACYVFCRQRLQLPIYFSERPPAEVFAKANEAA